jgi:AbiV family abortive infection protein
MAQEELGKMGMLETICYMTRVAEWGGIKNEGSDKYLDDWFANIKSHKWKQRRAINFWKDYKDENEVWISEVDSEYQHIFKKNFFINRENSIYVGLNKNGSINNPTVTIKKPEALKQISMVQEFIMSEILTLKKGTVGFYYDTEELTEYFCKYGLRIYKKLKALNIPISEEKEEWFSEMEKNKTITRFDLYG